MNVEEWHAWRKEGIGSSDAPVIMGVSPWSTPYKLWLEKTGRVQRDIEGNWATRRGTRLEPMARAYYEMMVGHDAPATIKQNAALPWQRGSLDGYYNGIVLEIKNPGKPDHDLALSGVIPQKYKPQVQHQLAVSHGTRCDYFSFYEGKGVIVPVYPDYDYIELLTIEEYKFWELVKSDTPPPMTDRDHKLVRSKVMKEKFAEYEALLATQAEIQTKIHDLKNELLEYSDDNYRVGDWKVTTVHRKGTIDYGKIQGIDFEQYRKPPTSYRQISKVLNAGSTVVDAD